METLLSYGNSSEHGQNSTGVGSASFDHLYPALIRVFAVIILGYIAGRLGVISVTEAKGLSKFAIFPTLPAFIFRAIATIDFSKLKWMFVFVVTLSKCIVFAGVTFVTFLFTRDIGKAGIYSMFCTVSNDLALGMPILNALYKHTHKDFLYSVYFNVLVNVTLFLTAGLLMMEYSQQRSRSTTSSIGATLFKTIKSILLSPVVLASLFGIAANRAFKQDLPTGVDAPLETLSNAFGATALFYLGLSVVGKIRAKMGMIILVPLSLSVAKVVILPLIIRGLCTSFNVGGDEMREDWSIFGFIYGTIPTAPTTVIYAASFGIQEDLIAFGLVISTMFSAPVMYSSSKMATVKNMNSTNIEYRNLLSNTRNDISFVAIILACWVVVILFLSRRYKIPPHNYTICLALSQLFLCISFVLTKLDSFLSCCKVFEAWLIATFLFATHCWTVILAFALASLRCATNQSLYANRLAMYIIGWGLPACCSGVLVLVLRSDIQDYRLSKKDFFDFFAEKHTFLAFWVTIQFICVPVCVGSLVRLYRCDKFCKCEMMKSGSHIGEATPLLAKSAREQCHRCMNSGKCASAIEKQSSTSSSTNCGTDIEDLDALYAIVKTKGREPEQTKLASHNNKLQLDKYYEGEQHQSARHIIVVVCQVLLMVVCIFYSMWILVGDEKMSGIFLEVQLLVSIILSAQILVLFAAFGFERALFIDPLLQKVRRYRYGIDEVILPQILDLPVDEYHICEQFVHYHKRSCVEALTPREIHESSLDNTGKVNGDSPIFFGSELVDWLLEVGLVADRVTAVHYGNSLLRGRVIRHSQNRYYFRDSKLIYEFCPGWDSEENQGRPGM
ncbi:integral membrane protein GPR155-like [Dendronephthya gigantea]|uniref:integral membrane protein GPR155-like n=1 Tax=Dendronephthya gigantea TaxID=151771 RepID=UPI00106C8413|nr:integral membrane protein GPR155-like [Dendronephthya gigantea]XP_028399447.1 integral membrane protein GPR155-like [Dendronephthya gigantea]